MDDNPYRGPEANPASAAPPRRTHLLGTVLRVLLGLGIAALLVMLLLPFQRGGSHAAARRHACNNQLRQIALALQHYAAVHHALPPAYTRDADGKPLHSWRTLILPYLEQRALYDSIDLSKSWNDPANAQAFNTPVDLYLCPANDVDDHRTTYLAIVTPTSCLRPGEPRNLADVTDGESETLIVIEVDLKHAVPWMQPVDADESVVLGIGPDSELAHDGGVNAACVDGSVHFLNNDLPAAQRRALISIAGGDKAAFDEAD